MNVHGTDDPAFLGNLDKFFLLLLEFFEFLLQVLDFALARILLQAVAAPEKLDLFVCVCIRDCKLVLQVLNLHGHAVVTVAFGAGALEALELGGNFLVLPVFRFESVDFGLEGERLGSEVCLDCGHLLIDVGGGKVAAAFASIQFAGEFRDAECKVRTVEFYDGVARLDRLSGHHVNLDHFGRARKANRGFGRFGNALECGNLALVHKAQYARNDNAENPGDNELVGIDVCNARVALVRVPEVI